MTAYLVSACGAVFLSVIVSFIIPQGKLGKSITFVLRIVCLGILISPITKLFNISESQSASLVDYDYVCEVYSKNQSSALEEYILKEFGAEAECDIVIAYGDEGFYAESVDVCLIKYSSGDKDKIYEYLEEKDYINITVYELGD